MTYIPKHFTLSEMTATNTALKNIPTEFSVICNLITLCEKVLDPIRNIYGSPIKVNSGYRCKAVNACIKGAEKSQHLYGQAADITCGSPDLNKKLFDLFIAHKFSFDQLIDEKGYTWIHISYSEGKNRNQVLHLK